MTVFKKKGDVIPDRIVLVDRHGNEWTKDASYQDRDVKAPGWLALRCGHAVHTFHFVVDAYGIQGQEERYLIVREEEP